MVASFEVIVTYDLCFEAFGKKSGEYGSNTENVREFCESKKWEP